MSRITFPHYVNALVAFPVKTSYAPVGGAAFGLTSIPCENACIGVVMKKISDRVFRYHDFDTAMDKRMCQGGK